MTAAVPRRLLLVGVGTVLAMALTAGCSGGPEPVPESHGRPVPRATVRAPTYAALAFATRIPGGSRVVSGTRSTSVPANVAFARWLSSGNVLLEDGRTIWVLDPRTGRRVGSPVKAYQGQAKVSVGRITVGGRDFGATVYDDALRPLRTVRVPTAAMRTDQVLPGHAELRAGGGVVVGDALWTAWSVNSEDDTRRDHGVLRIPLPKRGGQGDAVEVARNRPLVGLHPSSDGRALLALVRRHGHNVSCQSCGADNTIEEWDLRTGAATALGRPPGFDRWRLVALDKIGRRVVARFVTSEPARTASVQTWVRDDDGWTEQKSLRDSVVHWQRGVALRQVLDAAEDRGDGAPYVLRSGRTTLLTPATACERVSDNCLDITAPGPLLPPR